MAISSDEYIYQRNYNPLTKIICSVSPDSISLLGEMYTNGMSIVRINLSHIHSPNIMCQIIEEIKCIKLKSKNILSVAIDTCGPDLRLVIREPIQLIEGKKFIITNDVLNGDCDGYLNIPSFNVLSAGNVFTIDDGSISMSIDRVGNENNSNIIYCTSMTTKLLQMNKSVSILNVKLKLPKLTDTDYMYLNQVNELKIDYVFVSFVSSVRDIALVKDIVGHNGPLIIAKIESKRGVKNIKSILNVADGIMVARGDLLPEVGYFNMPNVQRMIVDECKKAGKPVIIATQVLETMIKESYPTRAEINDIGTAVYNKVDAIMLSAETSVGILPSECVDVVAKIAIVCEEDCRLRQEIQQSYGFFPGFSSIKFIVILSYVRNDVISIYSQRSYLPIVLVSNSTKYLASYGLFRGVFPYKCPYDLLRCNDVVIKIRMNVLMKEFRMMFNAKKGDSVCLFIRQPGQYLQLKLYKL